ncbi:hypothetical protein E1890_23935 [Salmonella enterica subsp. enterica serovar Mountpleasant]|nr:hypothetical protein [Salmonella enterica subsp. enterica serovar Mountpleasant]
MARKRKDGADVSAEENTLPTETLISLENSDGVDCAESSAGLSLSLYQAFQPDTQQGDNIMVQPLRYFTDSATGVFRTPSDEPFSVNRRRAAELYENGLVREVKPQPDNKMMPDPQTKS